MTKKELRKVAAERRRLLSDAKVAEYSRALLDHFCSFDLSGVKTIHVFIPIAEKKEPDTFIFIDWLATHHPQIKIIVPKADFSTALMSNYVYPGKEALIKNLYNILEPQKGELHTGDVDMVIIPMLVFDQRGYRVGYGKGFYDRFLLNLDTQKIGLSFFGPAELIADVNEYDVRLDFCITPEKTYEFKRVTNADLL
jgi:5-formyltetrahydrofolate cyclo-ligase